MSWETDSRSLICREDGSNKFYRLLIITDTTTKNSVMIRHYGAIGTAGQVQISAYREGQDAMGQFDKLIAEKMRKKYKIAEKMRKKYKSESRGTDDVFTTNNADEIRRRFCDLINRMTDEQQEFIGLVGGAVHDINPTYSQDEFTTVKHEAVESYEEDEGYGSWA